MAGVRELEDILGVKFRNPALLSLAITHSSYINENPGEANLSNERLEFLGDAVLGLVAAEKLYRELPRADEGDLTDMRTALVRREMLVRLAAKINLGYYLRIGKGEEAGGGRSKPANLASALEALVAAVYLDRGLEYTRSLILRLFGDEISRQASAGAQSNYKSKLQEMVQARRQVPPVYNTTSETGPDHAREFTVEVRVDDLVLGMGSGKSKKAAEMEAARAAIEALEKDGSGLGAGI